MVETGDRFSINGFTVVEVQRYRGPEWGKGVFHGGKYHGAAITLRLAKMVYGMEALYGPPEVISARPNKVMNAANKGRDVLHNAAFKAASQPKGWGAAMGLGKNAGSSCTANLTTLPNEHTTGSLARKAPTTITHSNATNTTTMVTTFTNTGGGQTAVARMALWNSTALASGNICVCNSFTVATLQINDIIKITETITAG